MFTARSNRAPERAVLVIQDPPPALEQLHLPVFLSSYRAQAFLSGWLKEGTLDCKWFNSMAVWMA